MIPLPCHSFFIYVARVDIGGCPAAERITPSKYRHPLAAVIDEHCRVVVMNDKRGEVKPFISLEPNNPKENNSLTATTKDAVSRDSGS
jgi:hypothetical protein